MDVTPSTEPNEQAKTEWRSCCLSADKHFIMYLTQIGLILLIMSFCIAQLLVKPDCTSQTAYTGLLTMLIGLVIPSPAIRKQ